MFSRVAMEKFGLSASHNGLVMSYIGIVTMVVQGVGVGYITKRYEDMPLLRLSCVLAAIAYAFIVSISHWLRKHHCIHCFSSSA